MASALYLSPFIPTFNSNGLPVAGASLTFFYTGTTTLAPVYADDGLTTPLTNPVISNAAAKYPNIYLNDAITYRVRTLDASGAPLGEDVDPYNPGDASTFLQSGTGAVIRTTREKLRDAINIFDFLPGATDVAKKAFVTAGNSVSTYLQAALNEAEARGGGDVYLPSVGAPYVLAAGVTVMHCVRIIGAGGRNFYGSAAAPISDWTRSGTWLKPTDTVNPAVALAAPGSAVIGVNFIHEQPTPSATPATAWTPTTYPYAVKVTQSYFELRDICILNATHGINIEYLETNGGGTYSALQNIWLGCSKVGIRYKNVNDTLNVGGIHHRNMWQVLNSNVSDYIVQNAIGDWYEYCDNPMVDGIEYFRLAIGQYFKDSTVTAGAFSLTHAMSYGQFDNVLFNLCKQAIAVENGTTAVSGAYGRVTVATDMVTPAAADYAIDLNSDNVTAQFAEMRLSYIGKSVLRLGNGTGGRASIGALMGESQAYAQNAAGVAALNIAAGAILTLQDGGVRLARPLGAGFRKVGAGLVNGPGRVLLGGGAIISAATVDISLVDYDLYRGIEIEFIGVVPATDGVIPYLRFSTDAGVTFLAANYTYAANLTTDSGANAPTGSVGANQIQMSHPTATVGNGAAEGINMIVRLMGQQKAGLWPRVTFDGCYIDNTATPQMIRVSGCGFHKSAIDVDYLRFLFSSGNVASGDYVIFGIL